MPIGRNALSAKWYIRAHTYTLTLTCTGRNALSECPIGMPYRHSSPNDTNMYVHVCVYVCVCACVRLCVCVRVRGCVCAIRQSPDQRFQVLI